MKILEIKDTVGTNKVLNLLVNAKKEDCLPITMISCRPDNLSMPFLNSVGLADKTHVFVNRDLIDEFKKRHPTINFYAREDYIEPGDFDGIENCPGGARILSFRGAKKLGFKRIISCDDDLLSVDVGIPLDCKDYGCLMAKKDFYKKYNINPTVQAFTVGSIVANMAFDHIEGAIVGDPVYKGMAFSRRPLNVKFPGCVFCRSDLFFIDLDRFQSVIDLMDFTNPLDVKMLKTLEDMFYSMLIFALGKTQFQTAICIKSKSTDVVTRNDGRTSDTLRELYPELCKDKRFGHIVSSDKLRITDTKGKTLNKDYSYFTTHNSAKFYESAVGKKAITWNITDDLPDPIINFDIESELSNKSLDIKIV